MGRLCPPAGRKTVRERFQPGIFRRDYSLFGVFYASEPLARFLMCKRAMNSILVIDDTEDIRNLIAAVLTDYGFTVREAPNGQRAVQMIAEEKPDLVICDVNMPAMSGYETLAAVRESSQTASIPFILMTGSVSHDGFRRGMVSGADDYLVKPFTSDELIEAVMSRLERQSELQLEADKRAQKLHEYAAHYAFPELAGSLDDTIGSAIA
jgi:CheY-like chemotaxis protein